MHEFLQFVEVRKKETLKIQVVEKNKIYIYNKYNIHII